MDQKKSVCVYVCVQRERVQKRRKMLKTGVWVKGIYENYLYYSYKFSKSETFQNKKKEIWYLENNNHFLS